MPRYWSCAAATKLVTGTRSSSLTSCARGSADLQWQPEQAAAPKRANRAYASVRSQDGRSLCDSSCREPNFSIRRIGPLTHDTNCPWIESCPCEHKRLHSGAFVVRCRRRGVFAKLAPRWNTSHKRLLPSHFDTAYIRPWQTNPSTILLLSTCPLLPYSHRPLSYTFCSTTT